MRKRAKYYWVRLSAKATLWSFEHPWKNKDK